MNPQALLPEASRSVLAEGRAARAALALAAAFGLGWLCWTMARRAADPGTTLFSMICFFQALSLLVFGTARAAASIGGERAARTWDLQRLTPQSALQLVVGKLAGAPLPAFFLFAAFLPWAYKGWSTSLQPDSAHAGATYALLGCTAFALLNLGLLVSAYTIESVGGTLTALAGAGFGFLAMLIIFASAATKFLIKEVYPISLYGHEFPAERVWMAAAVGYGLWALAGAVWRVGEDLLEPRRCWRLPVFMACHAAFIAGFHESLTWASTVKLAAAQLTTFAYLAALLSSDNVDRWRLWQESRGKAGWLDRTPVWVQACASYALIAAGAAAWAAWSLPGLGDEFRAPLAHAGFLVRDLALLQWLRLGRRGQPVRTAALAWAGLYIAPKLLLRALQLQDGLFIFSPVSVLRVSPALNVAPALLQAAAALALLASAKRRPLARPEAD